MKQIKLGSTELKVPAIAVGCMRINTLELKEAETFIGKSLELGANFFDHADIYGQGSCEEIFAKAIGMNANIREKIFLQSKCGIVKDENDKLASYNFSYEYIIKSVDGILQRLQTDYLDVLLLHRPDALVEPQEVAEAFDRLYRVGKVRWFGVSNQKPLQIQLLQKYLKQPIVANQLQLSITHNQMISNGINVNMNNESALDRDGSVLDFCRLHDITIQPWSPFQHGFFEGVFLDNPKFPELNKAIDGIAKAYGVSNTTIAMAWLLRHPAKLQPITGTTNLTRLEDCISATEIELSREEWYEIYKAAGNVLP